MMKKTSMLLTLLVFAAGCSSTQHADLVLSNGKIFTAEPGQPLAEALAIRGDRILAIGTSAEMDPLTGAATRKIDLQGHVVIPGINDAHYHSLFGQIEGYPLQFAGMEPAWEEVRSVVSEAVTQVPAGTWITGIVGFTVIMDPAATRTGLDEVAPDHPVRLSAYYGHGEIFNSKALEHLGLTDDTPDPEGGFFERDPASGKLNGRVFEYAQWVLAKEYVRFTSEEALVESFRAFSNEAIRFGITSIQDMPGLPLDIYVRVVEKTKAPIRIRAISMPRINADGPGLPESTSLRKGGALPVRLYGIKWILDGTPLERGAALREPYSDRPGWKGRLNFTADRIATLTRDAFDQNQQLLAHCSGDRTVETLFDSMEAIHADWPEERPRVEHGDGLTGDLVARAKRLGVIVVQNPTHLAVPEIRSRYGPDRDFFLLKSLLDAGIPLALGSDGPINPYLNIMLASVHPFQPSEAITREQAVVAYTRGSAYAESQELDKGTLSPGKLADLAVLSQDIFSVTTEALPATQSLLTMIGGRIVYDSGELN